MGILAAYDQPSDVVAEQGDVILEGPDGVAVTLTPDAAEETARRMVKAAAEAREQAGSDQGADQPPSAAASGSGPASRPS